MPCLRRCFKEEEEHTVLSDAEMSSERWGIFAVRRNKDILGGLGERVLVE